MEPFDPIDDSDAHREPQYEAYRADPQWQRVYGFLSGMLFHVSSEKGWKGILQHGHIAPSNDGHASRFDDQTVRRSFSHENSYVALFDFARPSEEAIRTWDRSHEVITKGGPAVLLELDRNALAAKLVPNTAGCVAGTERLISGNCIPFVEVWYPEPIPIAHVLSVHKITETQGLGLHIEP